jgi:hypothetical protein
MAQPRLRLTLSWVAGIIIFVCLDLVIQNGISSNFGLETSYYFKGLIGDEYFEGDRLTPLGFFFLILEGICASRVGMAIYYGNFYYGLGQHANLLQLAVIGSFGAYALVNALVWALAGKEIERSMNATLYNILDSGFLCLTCYVGFRLYQSKKSGFGREEKAEELVKLVSNDGDHFLEKKAGAFFLGYDNGKDLRKWSISLPQHLDQSSLVKSFRAKTGHDKDRYDFYRWLKSQGAELREIDWY